MTVIEELERMVEPGERVVYSGKPDKKCFIYESIFNPLLPFALLWAFIDFGIIFSTALGDSFSSMLFFYIPFFAVHLMPVWMYLGGALFSVLRHKNTAYVITDKAAYVSSGVLSHTIMRRPFSEIAYIDVHCGLFDRMFSVGDVIITTNQVNTNGSRVKVRIDCISDYFEVQDRIKRILSDMHSKDVYQDNKFEYNTNFKGF